MTATTDQVAEFSALVRDLGLDDEPPCPAAVPGERDILWSAADPARSFVARAELRCGHRRA